MFHIIVIGLWVVLANLAVLFFEDAKLRSGYTPKPGETGSLILKASLAGAILYLPILGIYYLIFGSL
jgi:hypothetical protein